MYLLQNFFDNFIFKILFEVLNLPVKRLRVSSGSVE